MGATSWRYYTPHQPIPEAAFRALRAEVFARGEYVQPAESIDDLLLPTVRRLGQNPDSPEQRRQVEKELQVYRAVETGDMSDLSPAIRAFATQIRGLRQATGMRGAKRGRHRQKRPRSIPELLKRAGENGTHSILDIESVSPTAWLRRRRPTVCGVAATGIRHERAYSRGGGATLAGHRRAIGPMAGVLPRGVS